MAPVVIEGLYGSYVYPTLVNRVLTLGESRPSRAGDTIDLGHVITHLATPYAALPLGVNRNVNRKIAAAEACQLIGGFSDVDLMLKASPNFARFVEPGLRNFHGAYGTRIGHQLPAVVHKLTKSSDTRQAVITLWDPLLDNQADKRDYPCTVMLQFELRNGYLNMHVVMRSNDVWLGVPYDWFQFSQLQLTVANVLGVFTGTYTHQSLSTHIYLTDVEAAAKLFTAPTSEGFDESARIAGFGGEDAIFKTMQRARQVTQRDLEDPTESEEWYRSQFRPAPHPSQLAGNVAPHDDGAEPTQPL